MIPLIGNAQKRTNPWRENQAVVVPRGWKLREMGGMKLDVGCQNCSGIKKVMNFMGHWEDTFSTTQLCTLKS